MAETSIVQHLNDNVLYLQTLIDNQRNESFFYFKVKLIVNKNNSFVLADKVIGISKTHMQIFWAEQDSSTKYQALNNAKKEGVNFELFEFAQQKLPLSKFDHFSLLSNSDPQFIPYMKSIIPSFSSQQYPSICKTFSILFLKSIQQNQTQCILCPSYNSGLELLYVLEMMKTLKSYEESLQKSSTNLRSSLSLGASNLKLMQMICNMKLGYLDINTQNFGYNCQTEYDQVEQKREMLIYQQSALQILKKNHLHQFAQTFTVKLYFKLIDETSTNYAVNFLLPFREKTENLQIKGCQINEEQFQTLMTKMRKQSLKQSSMHNRLEFNQQLFPTLKHLNLSQNKLTDNILAVFQRISLQQMEKGSQKNALHASNNNRILFPSLLSLDFSKNYITLGSADSHKNFISVLQNFSSFVLKINLSFNTIKSLDFFDKYFLNIDSRTPNWPVEYFDLKGNSGISQLKKQEFINSYVEKAEQLQQKLMTEMGFIIDFGEILYRDRSQLKYLVLLREYLKDQEDSILFAEESSFSSHFYRLCNQYQGNSKPSENLNNPVVLNQVQNSSNQISFVLSKSAKISENFLQPSASSKATNSQLSLSNNLSPSANSDQNILQTFYKLFYLKDYKNLSLLKKEIQQQQKVTQQVLEATFSKEWKEKRLEEKIIIQLFQQVTNFVDGKGKDAVKTQAEEQLINSKLDRLVGVIRRKGLEGQASDFITYMKFIRDQLIYDFLQTQQSFYQINPIYICLKRLKNNHQLILSQLQQSPNFIEVDYKYLSVCPSAQLQRIFFENKAKPQGQFDESLYDRLKYLLNEGKFSQKNVNQMGETMIKQLKLFPTGTLRNHNKLINSKISPFLKAKQKLTSTLFPSTPNKMQYLRKYAVIHYPFNSNINAEINRSGYQGIMSCLHQNENRHDQALSFIEVVNNFLAFLFYTPDTISEQTVTYINYIINYLNQVALETLEDLQWKEFLIEEFYLHVMSYKPEQKLNKGMLLNVFEYFTSRLICRNQLEKYVLSFLLQNQQSPLEDSHLILNSINPLNPLSSGSSQSLGNLHKEAKISWVIPNQFLLNSFRNQGKLIIIIKHDSASPFQSSQIDEFQLQVAIHQSATKQQLISHLLNQDNGYVRKFPLMNKSKITFQNNSIEDLQKYWLFEKKSKSNKLQYFRPYEAYRYIGEIVADNFQNQEKIVFYLRRNILNEDYHNRSYLAYEMDQTKLITLFNKMVSNLSMSIDLISKLPHQIIGKSYKSLISTHSQSFTPQEFITAVFTHIISIYCFQLSQVMKSPHSASSHIHEESIEQERQVLLHSVMQTILDGKTNKSKQRLVVNCKTFTIEQKMTIRTRVKELIQKDQKSRTSLGDKILLFINAIGDLAFCQTVFHQNQLSIINNRFIIVGKLLEHTNQLNQIVNIYSKLQFVIFFNEMTDFRLQLNEQTAFSELKLSFQKLSLNHKDKKIEQIIHYLIGDPYSIFCLYNVIVSTCKNILNFDHQLLYLIQSTGVAKTKQYRKSQNYLNSQNQKSNQIKQIQGLHYIPENFTSFALIRNKENESYERISQINSNASLLKIENGHNQPQTKKIENREETVEVYSRKSSKRGLKSNSSQRSLKKAMPRNESNLNQKSNQEESSSLIPSRKSLYINNMNPSETDNYPHQMEHSQTKVLEPPTQLRTQDIIKQCNQNQSQQNSKSQAKSQQLLKGRESDQVVNNQQRKSRKQMPKRRSSRDKDK